MKPLKCSICGYETNAVSEKKVKIICNGCFTMMKEDKIPAGKLQIKDGWLKDSIASACRDYDNLPKWLRSEI